MKHAPDRSSKISREILEYLLHNPDAQDTMDGILQWWLLEQHIKHNATLVRNAVSFLIRKDLVLVRQGKDMQTYFRINREKYQEISTFLKTNEAEKT